MGLTDIRSEVRRYTDKVNPGFTTAEVDAAVNAWYLSCWRHLDRVAPNRTRTTQTLALVADQTDAYTLTTAPLAIIDIFPPYANRHQWTFIAAINDPDFQRHSDQSEIWYAQEGETSLTIRPAISSSITATIHYIRKPPVITTSQAQLHFMDQTLANGAIGKLFHCLNFPDANDWLDERRPGIPLGIAGSNLKSEMDVFSKFGNNSNLTMTASGRFFDR